MPATVTDRLQGLTSSVGMKAPVVVASTGNITLSGTATAATFDGVTLPSSGRILLKDQTSSTQNGIYLYSGSTFERAADWDGARDAVPGTLVPVRDGTLYGGTIWTVNATSTATSIAISSDAMTFSLMQGWEQGLSVGPIPDSTSHYLSVASSSDPNLAEALYNQSPLDLSWGTTGNNWTVSNGSDNLLFRGRTHATVNSSYDVVGIDFRSVVDGGSSNGIVGGRFWGTLSANSTAVRGGTGVEGSIISYAGGELHASNFNVQSSGVATGAVHGAEYGFFCEANTGARWGVVTIITASDTAQVTGTVSPSNSTAFTVASDAGLFITSVQASTATWRNGIVTISQAGSSKIQIEDNLWYSGGWSSSYGLNWGHMAFGQAAILLPNNEAIKAFDSSAASEVSLLYLDTLDHLQIGTIGNIVFDTTGGTQFVIANTSSAANYAQVTGGVGETGFVLSSLGDGTNLDNFFQLKGSGNYYFQTNTNVTQFRVIATGGAADYVTVTGSTAGDAVTVGAEGSDTDIDILIEPKGSGNVRIGTHSTLGAETLSGYITIKDAAGNSRKVAVVS